MDWYEGAEHCGWQEAVFLRYGADESPQYLRDPEDTVGASLILGRAGVPLVSTFNPDVDLPVDAESTGNRSGDDISLWKVPGVDRHVYLVMPDRVERWPRLAHQLLCE